MSDRLRARVEKVIVMMRVTVAAARDYPDQPINREVVNETILGWAADLVESLDEGGLMENITWNPSIRDEFKHDLDANKCKPVELRPANKEVLFRFNDDHAWNEFINHAGTGTNPGNRS